MAPAMHTEMWEHPATQANVATLSERASIVPPASGRLTSKRTPGPVGSPSPREFMPCARLLEHPGPWPPRHRSPRSSRRAAHCVVGTWSSRRAAPRALDPVRFLGNRSSGKQGYAVAAAAAARGARVTLVTTADLQLPTGVEAVRVETAQQLRAAMLEHFDSADVIVMAAAVADFRPADYVDTKIKKGMAPGDDSAPEIRLVRNPDILAELVRHRGDAAGPVIVGFAAETGDAKASVLEHGRAKLERKGCDVLVVNEVGSDKTFGKDENTVHLLLQGSSRVEDVGPADKRVIADAIWDLVETLV